MSLIKGCGVGGGGGWWGWMGKPTADPPAIRPQTVVSCSQQTTGMHTNHKMDRDGRWHQSDTQPILISVLQWPNRTCNAPTRPYKVGKKPSVKAYLVIYSHTIDAAGQCMSESLMLGHNLDFSYL